MKKFGMSLMKYPKAINLSAAVVTAAVTAATLGAAHAAQTSSKPAARKKPVEVALLKKTPAPKQRVARKSIPTRVASTSPRLGTVRTAAISERASSAGQEAMTTSQSSATRIAMPVTNTSTVDSPKPGPRMIPLDNFKFSANMYYYGSSVATPFDSRVPDFYHGYQDRESGAVNAEVHFAMGYKFHPNWTFSLNPTFGISPSYYQEGDKPKDNENVFMKPIASYFRLSAGQFTAYKNFKWNGDFRVYPGITDDLKGGGTRAMFRTGQNFIFALSKSTTFAIYNTLRYNIRNQSYIDEEPGAWEFRVTNSPTLEQQLTDKVGLALSWNTDNRKAYNVSYNELSYYNHEADGPYIELGASLDLIENLNINPYIDTYTRRVNFYGTRWGLNLSYTIL